MRSERNRPSSWRLRISSCGADGGVGRGECAGPGKRIEGFQCASQLEQGLSQASERGHESGVESECGLIFGGGTLRAPPSTPGTPQVKMDFGRPADVG